MNTRRWEEARVWEGKLWVAIKNEGIIKSERKPVVLKRLVTKPKNAKKQETEKKLKKN